MNKAEFIKELDKLRKQNKDSWVAGVFNYNNNSVQYKAFNTWIQVLKVNGIDYAGLMTETVKGFKNILQTIPE